MNFKKLTSFIENHKKGFKNFSLRLNSKEIKRNDIFVSLADDPIKSGLHIEDAVKKGATIVVGGEWEGNRCQPTLLTGVSEDMTVCKAETFGPVTSIYPIDSYEEGLEKSNDTEYGLSSAIFTKNIDTALHFAKNISAGMCHINGPTIHLSLIHI